MGHERISASAVSQMIRRRAEELELKPAETALIDRYLTLCLGPLGTAIGVGFPPAMTRAAG